MHQNNFNLACAILLALALLLNGCLGGGSQTPATRFYVLNSLYSAENITQQKPVVVLEDATVPREDRFSIQAGRADLEPLDAEKRRERAALTYRRYCHHCHGPNGDGRIIVGESLELAPADLRSAEVQAMSEEALFEHVQSGGSLMIPRGATMSPGEMLLSIDHLRTLEGRESRPHFRPRNTEPLE